MPPVNEFNTGNDESPESSATFIIQTRGLSSSDGKRLTGPGIETFSTLKVEGLTKRFWQDRQSQFEMFPLGVDIVFTCENRLAALPRTTKVEG
jgi:alpha-D-ribose 1-methylphosphonate 5-triphosphate synthase subunit PhnH